MCYRNQLSSKENKNNYISKLYVILCDSCFHINSIFIKRKTSLLTFSSVDASSTVDLLVKTL